MRLSLLVLFGVLLVAWLAGALARRLGYPPILGELLAGMVFGPAGLGLFEDNEALRVLAEVGVYMLMLYIGMEVNPKALRQTSMGGLLAAIGGFVVPFFAGYAVTIFWGGTTFAALFLGLAMGVTSLATKSRILVDLDLVGTRIASVLLVAALLSDTAALVVFAAIIGMAGEGGLQVADLVWVLFKAVAFFGVAIWLGSRVLPLLGAFVRRLDFHERTANFTLVLMIGLVFAEMAELAGLHAILGAFIGGIFLREGVLTRRLSHEVVTVVHDLSLGFLAPIFFVMAGFHVSFEVVFAEPLMLATVIVVATAAKILGTALFYLPSGHGLKEGLTIGAGMNGRGAVEIIVAEIGLRLGIIDATVFSILVLMAFTTTLTVPVFLAAGVRWLRRDGELAAVEGGRVKTLIFGANVMGLAMAEALDDQPNTIFVDRNEIACAAARRAGYEAVAGDLFHPEVLSLAHAEEARQFLAIVPNAHLGALAVHHVRDEFRVPRCYTLQAYEATTPVGGRHQTAIEWLAVSDAEAAHVAVQTGGAVGGHEVLLTHEALSFSEADGHWQFGVARIPLVVERQGERTPVVEGMEFLPGDRVHCLPLRAREARPGPAQAPDEWIILDLPDVTTTTDWVKALEPTLRPALGDRVHEVLAEAIAEPYIHIAPGVAIPHTMPADPDQLILVAVRTARGLQCPGTSQPAFAQFALVAGANRRGDHLRLLARIARLVQAHSFMDTWLNARDDAGLRRVATSEGEHLRRLRDPGPAD